MLVAHRGYFSYVPSVFLRISPQCTLYTQPPVRRGAASIGSFAWTGIEPHTLTRHGHRLCSTGVVLRVGRYAVLRWPGPAAQVSRGFLLCVLEFSVSLYSGMQMLLRVARLYLPDSSHQQRPVLPVLFENDFESLYSGTLRYVVSVLLSQSAAGRQH